MKLTAVAYCALLAGCAIVPSSFSPGARSGDFDRDRYECNRDAFAMPNADGCAQMRIYEQCMTVKGHTAIPGTGNRGMCRSVF